jgi:malate/lactate dehydrogenase
MTKIAIVGAAGGIGSSVAYTMALHGVGTELILIDRNAPALTTQVMDLEQLRVNVRPYAVRSGALDDLQHADVVVVSASVPARKDLARMEYLTGNLEIFAEVVDALPSARQWPGVLVVATNPVDPLVTYVQRATGLDRRRVVGYTVNDSLRLRYGIALAVGVEPHRVTAWVIGEHGDRCVPLFDRVMIDDQHVTLTDEQRDQALRYLLDWYPTWVSLGVSRTSTWTSGNGVASMVKAIIDGSSATWPASFVTDGEYGVSDVAISLPVELGPAGIAQVRDWRLSDDDQRRLRDSARFVADSLRDVDTIGQPA